VENGEGVPVIAVINDNNIAKRYGTTIDIVDL
jgi:hypothetical protein